MTVLDGRLDYQPLFSYGAHATLLLLGRNQKRTEESREIKSSLMEAWV